ncbi:MAG TPA: choice-of-anchor J domain-containing protein [Flavobacterium sp.]|jgi:hypothetical protein
MKIRYCIFFIVILVCSWGGSLFAQGIACPEGFDAGSSFPAGWTTTDNLANAAPNWAVTTTFPHSGTQAAYIDRGNQGAGVTSEETLITPQITVPANGQLRFFSRLSFTGDQGTLFRISVATSPSGPFTLVQAYTEWQLNTVQNVYEEKLVSLSAYAGQNIYIAFKKIFTQPTTQLAGERWWIDDVRVISECPIPASLTAQLTNNTATLSWAASGASEYQVEYMPSNVSQGSGTTVSATTNSVSIPWADGQNYAYYVRAKCASCAELYSPWAGPYHFRMCNVNNGSIVIKSPSRCVGEPITFSLNSTIPIQSYAWTFYGPLGMNTQSGAASPTQTFTEPGTYQIQATIASSSNCNNTFYSSIVIGNCNQEVAECDVHFNFNFKAPDVVKGSGNVLNLNERTNIAKGVTNFINNNVTDPATPLKRLFISSFDDSANVIARVIANNDEVTAPATPLVIAGPNEVHNNFLRIQDNNYNNTFSNIITNSQNNGILNNATIDNIDVSFFIISQDKYTDINVARSAYTALLASKAEKVFFVLCEEGTFAGTPALTPVDFVTQVKQSQAINYNATNNILTSDYIVYSKQQFADNNFEAQFSEFLEKAYRDVAAESCTDGGCTEDNPLSAHVENLFQNLIRHIVQAKANGATDADINNQDSAEMQALRPYITDPNARVYNFSSVYIPGHLSSLKFSFSQEHDDDVIMDGNLLTILNVSSFHVDLSNYTSAQEYLDLNADYLAAYPGSKIEFKKFVVRHIEFCPPNDCRKKDLVTSLFVNLINHLYQAGPVSDGYNCAELDALRPYLTDPNARIYNYHALPFSFSFHKPDEKEDPKFDVLIDKGPAAYPSNVASIDLINYNDPYSFTDLSDLVVLANGEKMRKAFVRHVIFCPPVDTECTKGPIVEQLFQNLLKHLIQSKLNGISDIDINNDDSAQMQALRPYVTDERSRVCNFTSTFSGSTLTGIRFSFFPEHFDDVVLEGSFASIPNVNFHISLDSFVSSEVYMDVSGNYQGAYPGSKIELKKFKIRHIDFCPEDPCPKKALVTQLFINLLNHLYQVGPVNDGYNCAELDALRPYLTDNEARIYNFNSEPFSFSFHPVTQRADYDVLLDRGPFTFGSPIASIDMVNYNDPLENTLLSDLVFMANGEKSGKASVRHVIFCPPENEDCIAGPIVESLFQNLMKHLVESKLAGTSDAYINSNDSAPMIALRQYVTDEDARVCNFTSTYNQYNQLVGIHFSFDPKHDQDVVFEGEFINLPNVDFHISLQSYVSPDTYMDVSGDYQSVYPKMVLKKFLIRHIDFCPEVDCPQKIKVNQLFINLINHLRQVGPVTDGYNCSQLDALRPYLTDPEALIYDYQSTPFAFSFHKMTEKEEPRYDVLIDKGPVSYQSNVSVIDLSNYSNPFQFTDLSSLVMLANGEIMDKAVVRHVIFCPGDDTVSCTKSNENYSVIKELFIALANKLVGDATSITNGYSCQELVNLAPYISDANPAIYDFAFGGSFIRFSFAPHGDDADVLLPIGTNSIVNIDLLNFDSSEIPANLQVTLENNVPVKNNTGFVKHINFCPEELYCVSHVSIVVDESGSLDERELRKIRKQLKSFVAKQASVNDLTGTNIHISLIGLSDSDNNSRTDEIPATKITAGNLGAFNAWIDNYGLRYETPNDGISEGSDYWNSGLSLALDMNMKPDIVILITDGCQALSVPALKATMERFNNNENAQYTEPHLYVVGIENGFYVDDESQDKYTQGKNPNLVPDLQMVDPLGKVTSFLRKSLKYLLNYPSNPGDYQFPLASLEHFTPADYYGHNNFDLLGSDTTYFSDKLAIDHIICEDPTPKDLCDDCVSFQPEPGKKYLLSAWVKEESKEQVKDYVHAKINIVFYNDKKALTEHVINPPLPAFGTSGEIIDGWQRIVGTFTAPVSTNPTLNTITLGIELNNGGDTVPVYFDDIRIHPLDGSMKSFVYDPETFKLMSELDENNYSTFYEYDNEGGLVRIKKETAKGIKTIQETRSGNAIQNQDQP